MILTTDGSLLGLHPLKLVYLGVLVFSMGMLLAMNVWVERRAATSRLEAVVPLHNASALWALVSALGLLVGDQQLNLWLTYLRTVLSYVTTILFVRFATVYSGRSTAVRRPFNAVYLGVMTVGLLGLVTDPWLGLHFEPLVYHTTPFPYYETGFGPLWQLSLLCSYVGIAVALYYLVELLVTSQYRSSRPLAVYVLGIGLAVVPSVLTATQQIPALPGYDHSVFGLSLASLGFFSGAWLGMLDIAPISRDRLLETSEDGLVVVDDDGRVADHNTAAEAFFTDPGGNQIGRRLDAVAPVLADAVPEPYQPSTGDSGATNAAGDCPRETRRVDFTHGDDRHYSMVVSPITDLDTVRGYVLLLRDVTDRYENRQELRRQHEQFDHFARSIAHHLLNPLQIASGQIELAREQLAATDGATSTAEREQLADIEQSLDRMNTIITDLQTLAKQGKSVEGTEATAFGDAVAEARDIVGAEQATVSVARDGTIQADRGRLLSILENLIRNSLEHAGSGVTIELRLTEDGFVFEDDGPGIDADHDRLFEYGYTTSDEGTGLGLSIVKTMVDSHGWEIRVDPDHDGARFVVTGAVTTPTATAE